MQKLGLCLVKTKTTVGAVLAKQKLDGLKQIAYENNSMLLLETVSLQAASSKRNVCQSAYITFINTVSNDYSTDNFFLQTSFDCQTCMPHTSLNQFTV